MISTWIHGINSEIHHCDYARSPSGFDAWMQSLNQFFCSCVRAWVNLYILHPGCCGLRIENCNAIFACICDEANRPTGHWHRMPRLSKDVWLNIFIWSTPAQSLCTWNCVLCIGGREPIDCYCCAASEHVHCRLERRQAKRTRGRGMKWHIWHILQIQHILHITEFSDRAYPLRVGRNG